MRWAMLMAVVFAGTAMGNTLEERALALDRLLMAPCCWTQTLNNHHSGIANEMRRDIRRMLTEGKSEAEILDHFKAIHSVRILAMPPAKGFNWAAYVLPVAFLLVGGWLVRVVLLYWRRNRAVEHLRQEAASIDGAYADRLARELKEGAV